MTLLTGAHGLVLHLMRSFTMSLRKTASLRLTSNYPIKTRLISYFDPQFDFFTGGFLLVYFRRDSHAAEEHNKNWNDGRKNENSRIICKKLVIIIQGLNTQGERKGSNGQRF